MPSPPFSGKLALVTGGSGSIGAAVARRLAADGAAVLVHYGTNRDGAAAAVAAIVAAGGEAQALQADLAALDGPAALVAQLDAAFGGRFAGRLDILVNNAGLFEYGTLTDATDEEFERVFNVNVRAPFILAREAARRMTASGWGRIISIGSVFGEAVPSAGLSLYSGSKFALHGFTRAWSRDLGSAGITVNGIAPAVNQPEPVPTGGPAFEAMQRMTSIGRFGAPEEIAHAVAFLADPKSGFITGDILTVDGGWSA
jgi:3-oxoacyl-[acyl-carrier protein] reductase